MLLELYVSSNLWFLTCQLNARNRSAANRVKFITSKINFLCAEKIYDLENKLKRVEDEFRRRHKTVAALEAQLEAAKVSNNYQLQIEEISLMILMNDDLILAVIMEGKTCLLR